jgi:hypothetical protein
MEPLVKRSFGSEHLSFGAVRLDSQRAIPTETRHLLASYLTLDDERNKYRPDIGSQRCGGPSCCMTSSPGDVSCSLVRGKMSIGLLP